MQQPPGGGYANPQPAHPGSYAQGQGAPPQQGGTPPGAPPKKKSSVGLVLGLVFGALLLAGGAVAAYFLWFSGPSSKLSGQVPADVELFVEIPSFSAAVEASTKIGWLNPEKIDTSKVEEKIVEAFDEGFDLDEDQTTSLLEGIDGIAVAARDLDDEPAVAVLVSFADAQGVEALLATDRFEEDGELAGGTRYLVEKRDGDEEGAAFDDLAIDEDDDERLVWFADEKILVMGQEELVEDVGAALAGDEETLADTEAWKEASFVSGAHALIWVQGKTLEDLQGSDELLDDLGDMTVSAKLSEVGLHVSLRADLAGDAFEEGLVPKEPPSLDLPHRLPAETVLYLAMGMPDESGDDLEERLLDALEDHDEALGKKAERALKKLDEAAGFDLPDLLDALGDQLVLAVAASDDIAFDPEAEPAEYVEDAAVALVATVGDDKRLKDVLEGVREKLFEEGPAKEIYDVDEVDGGFDADPKKRFRDEGAPAVRVRHDGSRLVIAAGGLSERFVEAVMDGEDVLSEDGAHQKAIEVFESKPLFVWWMDFGRGMKIAMEAAEEATPDFDERIEELEEETGFDLEAIVLEGDGRLTGSMAVGVERKEERWQVNLEMVNVAGLLPPLAIYGVRRYLASSKTSEAKNVVGAISRGASAAYEREAVVGDGLETTHALCKSAAPVPAKVPRGRKYQPSPAEGEDYLTGDAQTGWRCLKFAMTQPHYYQYQYIQGGPYKGPARGGPDPGPNGFEVSAEGDLDGDGKTSLFTRIGTVDENGRLKLSTQLFIVDELE